jgi:hypothetical protein
MPTDQEDTWALFVLRVLIHPFFPAVFHFLDKAPTSSDRSHEQIYGLRAALHCIRSRKFVVYTLFSPSILLCFILSKCHRPVVIKWLNQTRQCSNSKGCIRALTTTSTMFQGTPSATNIMRIRPQIQQQVMRAPPIEDRPKHQKYQDLMTLTIVPPGLSIGNIFTKQAIKLLNLWLGQLLPLLACECLLVCWVYKG